MSQDEVVRRALELAGEGGFEVPRCDEPINRAHVWHPSSVEEADRARDAAEDEGTTLGAYVRFGLQRMKVRARKESAERVRQRQEEELAAMFGRRRDEFPMTSGDVPAAPFRLPPEKQAERDFHAAVSYFETGVSPRVSGDARARAIADGWQPPMSQRQRLVSFYMRLGRPAARPGEALSRQHLPQIADARPRSPLPVVRRNTRIVHPDGSEY